MLMNIEEHDTLAGIRVRIEGDLRWFIRTNKDTGERETLLQVWAWNPESFTFEWRDVPTERELALPTTIEDALMLGAFRRDLRHAKASRTLQ